MKFYWVKTSWVIKKLFPKIIWSVPNNHNTIYLTFDDGPTPEITTWVLSLLEKHQAKATFFCIGKNIEANYTLYEEIKNKGHQIGNHTFNHLNGWKTNNEIYIKNVDKCQETIQKNTKLFRPPYGKITLRQASLLRKKGYKIILWEVLSADFDQGISPEKCLENLIQNCKPGSIIVFHDSVKAFKNLHFCLPKFLEFAKEQNFNYAVL